MLTQTKACLQKQKYVYKDKSMFTMTKQDAERFELLL